MKEIGTSHWNPPNTGATNESGFTGLPGGSRNQTPGVFTNLHITGTFWTSTQNTASDAWHRKLYYYSPEIFINYDYKVFGFSVRCLKN